MDRRAHSRKTARLNPSLERGLLALSSGTAVQLFVIRPILTNAVPTPIQLGFWGRLLVSPRSLAQAGSFLGLTVFFLSFAFLIHIWHDALTSNGGRVSFVGFLLLNCLLIITVGLGVALFLKLRASRSPD